MLFRKLLLDGECENEVLRSIAQFGQKVVEPAGVAFHQRQKVFSGILPVTTSTKKKKGGNDIEDNDDNRVQWEKKRAATPLSHAEEALGVGGIENEENYYEVLGIGHLGFNASDKDIRRGYQKMLLIYHPDKTKAASAAEQALPSRTPSPMPANAETDPKFLAVQKAYEVLSNPNRRRGYDSQFDFDDAIPSGVESFSTNADFFRIYGPVFEANSRFSTKKPAPLLGDENTPIAEVKAFYQFWRAFQSWRDFSMFDEHKNGDIEGADSREERRHMQRENENQQKKRKKKEMERISLLVERAYKVDFRIINAKKEAENSKLSAQKKAEEEKAAKELAERLEKEEKERAAAEAERIRKETAESAKKEKEKAKKLRKKLMKQILGYVLARLENFADEKEIDTESALHDFEDGLDLMETNVELATSDSLKELADKLEADESTLEPLNLYLNELRSKLKTDGKLSAAQIAQEEQKAAREEERKKRAGESKPDITTWSPEELSVLSKGMQKYPAGSRNRWQMISQYVNQTMANMSHLAETGSASVVTVAKRSDRSEHECIMIARSLAQGARPDTDKVAFDQFKNQPRRMDPKEAEAIARETGACVPGMKRVAAPKEDASAASTSVEEDDQNNGDNSNEVEDVWTAEQQEALEIALKAYPASMEKNERWRQISNVVPDKSKKQCLARYKKLRDLALAKKKAPKA